jgi:hypothetical protein
MHGTISGSPSALPKAAPSAVVVLEGFDLSSGVTTWSFDAGHNFGLITQTELPALAGAHTIVIPDVNGQVKLIDLSNGSAIEATPTDTYWCVKIVTYKQRLPSQTASSSSLEDYVGQFAVFPCNSKQERVAVPSRVPDFVSDGATADGLVAWSDEAAVVAAP